MTTPRDDRAHVSELLDRSIPGGFGPSDPAPLMRAGRRALVRRRVAAVAGSLAVVVVVGTGVAVGSAAVPDSRPGQGTQVASAGPPSAGTQSLPAVTPSPGSEFQVVPDVALDVDPDVDVASFTPQGRLVLPPGGDVVQAIENPFGYEAPSYSLAVEFTVPDLPPSWAVFTIRPDLAGTPGYEEDGLGGVIGPVEDDLLSFAQWTFTQVTYNLGDVWPYNNEPSIPSLDLDGEVVLPDTATLVAQVEDPLRSTGTQRSTAIAFTDPTDSQFDGEQWVVMVVDTAWRAGDPNPLGLLNGFAYEQQDAEPGVDFEDWAASRSAAGFRADSPPGWAGGTGNS